MPKYLNDKSDFPFIVICPQCPTNSFWAVQVDNLNYFLDKILEKYDIDKERIYLTGLSMGGYGAWFFWNGTP